MKKNQNYEINFATNTITVTKKFLQDASQMGNEAFTQMQKLRELNMPISVREIKRKKTGAMWSFERMEFYLNHVENGAEYRKQYDALWGNSRATVWAWFRKTFPHCKKLPVLNEKCEYLVHPAEYEKQNDNVTSFRGTQGANMQDSATTGTSTSTPADITSLPMAS